MAELRRRRGTSVDRSILREEHAEAVSTSSSLPPANVIVPNKHTAGACTSYDDAQTAKTSLLSETEAPLPKTPHEDDDDSEVSSDSWERMRLSMMASHPTNPVSPHSKHHSPFDVPEEEASDAANSNDSANNLNTWSIAYEPAPLIEQRTVLTWGFACFVLAMMWPPLILFFAYIASKIIPYSYRTNDDPVNRRKLFADFVRQGHDLPPQFTSLPEDIELQDSYWTNERGMLLHTITMLPTQRPIRAVVLYCHGYTDNVSFEKILAKQRLVREGIAFCAIEYEGHGLSDGPMGLIGDWNALVTDVTQYAQVIRQRFPQHPLFLMGESMGGAVAYSVQRRIPELIRGVVFVCPMCKISDNMLPPRWVIDFLNWLIGPSGDPTSWLGYLPIAPARDQMVTHKDPAKLLLASRVPLCFGRNPRLATARELIATTQTISASMHEFDAPFLVVHGLADTVTDPQLSRALYEESRSTDKTLKLYDDMWHALMCGEPDENANRVFRDCIQWILDRVDD